MHVFFFFGYVVIQNHTPVNLNDTAIVSLAGEFVIIRDWRGDETLTLYGEVVRVDFGVWSFIRPEEFNMFFVCLLITTHPQLIILEFALESIPYIILLVTRQPIAIPRGCGWQLELLQLLQFVF